MNTENIILKCLSENYRLDGNLSRLSGENLNYLLTLDDGNRQVVKIVDEDMPASVVQMEFQALKYAVFSGFPLKLPKIIENIYGNIETGIKIHINTNNRLRIIEFIEGIEIENMPDISTKMLKNVGETIAGFDLAMQGFDHPAAHRSHRWNLAEAGRHMDKVSLVEGPEKRALLQWGFDQWKQVEGRLEELPWQFIHGDLNRENILVHGDRIVGLVDFGDCCMNPVVCDLAIALAYFMMDQKNPLETARLVIQGYEKLRGLDAAEREVLLPLVCGRLAVSNAIAQARKRIDPDNPNWFGSEGPAWRLLARLREMERLGMPAP